MDNDEQRDYEEEQANAALLRDEAELVAEAYAGALAEVSQAKSVMSMAISILGNTELGDEAAGIARMMTTLERKLRKAANS